MFIVHLYTALLFIFTGFLNNSYAMVIHSDNKNQSNHRSDRQIRPVLNGIIFLLAANLVAKGTLALGGFQTPNLPNNLQGSLYLTLNGPQQNPNLAQQNHPIWYPISNQVPYTGLTTQRPISQHQIVNIRDPFYDEIVEDSTKSNPIQKIIINRYNNPNDIIPAASEEINVKLNVKKGRQNHEDSGNSTEDTTEYYVNDVEILPATKQIEGEEEVEEIDDSAKQQATTTVAPTTRQSQRPTNQTTLTADATTTIAPNQGYTIGYGPSNGYENVSITTEAPLNNNMTGGNVSDTLQPPPNNAASSNNSGTLYGPPNVYTPQDIYGPPNSNSPSNTYGPPTMYGPPHVGPHYYPSGNYGPSNGNENISITYGAPAYQKPFFSSPADPYLNNYYNNYYDSPSYYSDLYKYSDVFNKFYNRYQYNYPSLYNNYLGK